MKYIFPVPLWLRGKILEHKRLYAFPAVPEDNPFILDSGAFALSKSGGKMDAAYLERLYKYYKKYPDANRVAPDVFLNPRRTMKNFKLWMDQYSDCRVWPVIQCSSKKIEWASIEYQLDFYSEFFNRIEILFFSNPSLRAGSYPKDIFKKIKDLYRVDWIHNLGAGWDIQDIRGYATLGGLDSIDSIAYYNCYPKNWHSEKLSKVDAVILNAKLATQYV